MGELAAKLSERVNGLRASKTVNGAETTYQYVGDQLLYENRNGTDIYYYYDSYGTPTAIRYYKADGTSYRFFLATNSLGDVIGLYNANGTLAVKYEYDAWGNIISTTDADGDVLNSLSQEWSDINPFRYRGYYYDAETELYYLQSRYYDAEVGRFINQDSYVSTGTGLLGYNMFAYCDNNPVNGWDPTGEAMFECCPHGDCYYCKEKEKDPLDIVIEFIDVLFSSLKGEAAIGLGFGTSGKIEGVVGYDVRLSLELLELVVTPAGYEYYLTLYAGVVFSYAGFEYGFEIHDKLSWTSFEFEPIHNGVVCRPTTEIGLEISAYDKVGARIAIYLDAEEAIPQLIDLL